MSFSRAFLKANGLSEDQITSVMDEHTAVVEALKQQRDGYKADADKLATLQANLDAANNEINTLKSGDDFKAKYEQEHNAYEAYKAEVKKNAEMERLKAAYRKLLVDEKISEKRLDAVIRLTDFSTMSLDEEGNLNDLPALKEAIGKEWGEYKVTPDKAGVNPGNPPAPSNDGFAAMSLTQKMAYANQNPTAPEVVAWLQKKT